MALITYRVLASEDFKKGDKLTLIEPDRSAETVIIEARKFNPQIDFCEVGFALADTAKGEYVTFLGDEVGLRVERLTK